MAPALLRAARALLGRDLAPLPLRRRLAGRRLGFTGWSTLAFELDRNDPADYLPDTAIRELKRVNGAAVRSLLRNKLLFAATFGRVLRVPRVLGLVDAGRVVPWEERMDGGADGLLRAAERLGGVIVKPVADAMGRGVHLVEAEAGRARVDGRELDRAALERWIGGIDGSFVSERVRAAAYAREIFAGATATLRLISVADPDDGVGRVVCGVQRIGSSESAPTDNAGRGGIVAALDLRTGRLGEAYSHLRVERGRLARWPHHPETGARVEGVTVPFVADVVASIEAAHRAFPGLRYCGWDVAVTDDGPVVIEGNDTPALMIQVSCPFRGDPLMRRFLDAHGIGRR